MNIDSIQNGIVIDHIAVGRGKSLYDLLKLDELDCSVALLRNVVSSKYGRKDIIKIDRELDVNLSSSRTARLSKRKNLNCRRNWWISSAAIIPAAFPRPSRKSRRSSD